MIDFDKVEWIHCESGDGVYAVTTYFEVKDNKVVHHEQDKIVKTTFPKVPIIRMKHNDWFKEGTPNDRKDDD